MGRTAYSCALAMICLLGPPGELRAERWLRLDPLRGEIYTEFDGSWRRAEDSPQARELDIETGLRLRQTGAIINRRISTFSLEIEPVFSFADLSGSERAEDSRSLNLNYAVSATALQGTPGPVGFTGDASRSTGTQRGDLGTQRDFDLLRTSVSANWKTPIFPSVLRLSQRSEKSEFRSAFSPVPTLRDEVLRSMTYTGHSRKLDVLLEHEWLDDRRENIDNDRVQDRANFRHRFLWGKGSSLFTNLTFFDRRGFNPSRSLLLSETARIKHTDSLDSTTAYRFNYDQRDAVTLRHSGSFGLRHKLYTNLTSRLDLNGSRETSEIGDETVYGANAGVGYQKKIPWNGRLTAGVQGGYRITDRRSLGGLQQVVDETHTVPATLVVVLAQRFIDPVTMIVTSVGCAVACVEGVDYTVVQVAHSLTEIRVTFGGAIGVGDAILVSYSFQVAPSLRFSTLTSRYDVGLDFGWVAIFHSGSRSNDRAISGPAEEFLNETQDTRTRIVFRWRGQDLKATLSAEDRFTKSGSSKAKILEIDQTLSYKVTPRLNVSAGASQIFTESTNRKTTSLSANASARWFPVNNLEFSPVVKFDSLTEKGGVAFGGDREDRFFETGFDLRWWWRKIEILLDYRHNTRTGLDVPRTEDRVFLRITRRL